MGLCAFLGSVQSVPVYLMLNLGGWVFFFFLGRVVPGRQFKKKSLRNFFFSLEGGTVRNWENSYSAQLLTIM